jgi:hypothetical protein
MRNMLLSGKSGIIVLFFEIFACGRLISSLTSWRTPEISAEGMPQSIKVITKWEATLNFSLDSPPPRTR